MPKAIAQFTIRDENDITIGVSAPPSPIKDQMWLDTSKTPSIMKRYSGSVWEVVNDPTKPINDAIDSIQIGGRNLALNTINGYAYYFAGGSPTAIKTIIDEPTAFNKNAIKLTINEVTKGIGGLYFSLNTNRNDYHFIVGKTYTISGYIKQSVATSSLKIGYEGGGNDKTISLLANTWTYFSYTFTVTTTDKAIHFYDYNTTYWTSGTTQAIHSLKIEEGNIATSWTPAPEDIDQKIESVTTIANGKNSIYYSTSTPIGTFKENDIWFDTDDGYKMYRYNKNSWVATQFSSGAIAPSAITTEKIDTGAITAGKIFTGAVTADKIDAFAITAGKLAVGSVTADAIATGSVTANKIASYTITANKLLIGDTNNLCNLNPDNASMRDGYAVVQNTTDKLNYFKIGSLVYSKILLFKTYNNEIKEKDEFSFNTYGFRDVDCSLKLACRYYYTDNTYEDGGSVDITPNVLTIAGMTTSIVLKITKSPNNSKVLNYTDIFIEKGNDTTTNFYLRNIKLYKRYAGELLVDGSIKAKQIAGGSILAQHLNVQDIFANQAFINSIQAIELKAESIKTGIISNDRLSLKGFIGFEALSSEFDGVFDLSNPTQTYINGNKILTGSITADKINTRGLVAKNQDNQVTFEIKEDTGDVVINNAFFKSNNFESGRTGYQISTDGNAEFNNAVLRGNVILPNAGMTNDYDMSQIVGRNLCKQKWEGSSSFIVTMNNGYTSIGTDEIAEDELLYCMMTGKLDKGEKYTLSIKLRNNTSNEIVLKETVIENPSIYNGEEILRKKTIANEWVVLTNTFIASRDNVWGIAFELTDFELNLSQVIDVEWIKVEKGIVENPIWTPAPEDDLNPVRIWAGSDESSKNTAPFRVLQDGSVYATKGNFNGTFSGEVNVGNIKMFDTINSDSYIQMYNNSNTKILTQISGEKDTFFSGNFYIKKINSDFKILDIYNDSFGYNDSIIINTTLKTTGDDSKFVNFPTLGTEELIEMASNEGKVTLSIGDGMRFTASHYLNGTPGKFVFEKADGSPVGLEVLGDLYVENEFRIGNNGMKIVGLNDSNGKGYDFIVI